MQTAIIIVTASIFASFTTGWFLRGLWETYKLWQYERETLRKARKDADRNKEMEEQRKRLMTIKRPPKRKTPWEVT